MASTGFDLISATLRCNRRSCSRVSSWSPAFYMRFVAVYVLKVCTTAEGVISNNYRGILLALPVAWQNAHPFLGLIAFPRLIVLFTRHDEFPVEH